MDAFIARQAIFDRHRRVQGYEILFRTGIDGALSDFDPDQASSRVISTSLGLADFDSLTGGRTPFFNVSREFLVRGMVQVLAPASAVIEVLETVTADEEVLEVLSDMKGAGYRFALDDFRLDPGREALLPLADYVKVDVLQTSPGERREIARRLAGTGTVLVAEKVETEQMFQATLGIGFKLFQGYFFTRPKTLAYRDIPASRLNQFRILQEVNRPDLDLQAMVAVIESEVALAYKLLRFLNSPFFALRGKVESIRQALFLLGDRQVRNWATIIALAEMAGDEPGEVVVEALLRGRFCELLAARCGLGERSSDLLLMGMFSLLDAILDRPLDRIISEIPLAADVREALLGSRGPLRDVLDVVISHTTGRWDEIKPAAGRLNLDAEDLPACYASALQLCGAAEEIQAAA